MHNAMKAKRWIVEALGDQAVSHHFAALSTNTEAVAAFGVSEARMFGFWEWVGGRYSVWSSIGLSLVIALGPEIFGRFLDGARAMDQHFQTAPAKDNIPVLMALLGVWYRNGFGLETLAVLPYEQRLHRFSAYLQQMEMESNGKRVDREGAPVNYDTCPVIWGEPGTNGQHAFFQLLHQGTLICPVDFILTANPTNTDAESHALLNANCLAQAESLAFGKTEDAVYREMIEHGQSESEASRLAPHRSFPGNRPSSLIMMDALTPEHLGALIAAYEHKVFTQGVIWNINSYDQWGVELGKAQCIRILDLHARDVEMVAQSKNLTADEISRVIEMAWEDRTPFEAIEASFGLNESQVIELMRREMKSSSFKMWRARVSGSDPPNSRRDQTSAQRSNFDLVFLPGTKYQANGSAGEKRYQRHSDGHGAANQPRTENGRAQLDGKYCRLSGCDRSW